MGLITSKDRIRDPETILVDLHDLNGQSGYSKESKKEFMVKVLYIVVLAAVMRIASMQQLPSLFDVVIILFAGVLIGLLAFSMMDSFNRIFRRRSRSAFIALFVLVVVVILMGA